MLDPTAAEEVAVCVDVHARRDADDAIACVRALERDFIEPAVARLDRPAGRILEAGLEERLRDGRGWQRGRHANMDARVEIELRLRGAAVDLGRRAVGPVGFARKHGFLEICEHFGHLDERGLDPPQPARLAEFRFFLRLGVGPQFRASRAPGPGIGSGHPVGDVDRLVDAAGTAARERGERRPGEIRDGLWSRRVTVHAKVYACVMADFPFNLKADECRVLGTLIEKALTTPAQYPLSLNALVNGVNQKSNRDPVVEIDEDRALRAVDGLRSKGLVRDVSFTGSRVEKFKHSASEALGVRAPEQALLAELLLRGPQTVGELRGRASRMHPFDSIEAVEGTLASIAGPERPLVREVAPLPGSRATRWTQLLCPELHPIEAPAARAPAATVAPSTRAPSEDVEQRLAELESRVAALERGMQALRGV